MGSDWPVTTVGSICDLVTKGTTPTTLGFGFKEGDVNFVKVESITRDGCFIGDKLGRISDATHRALKRSQLRAGDVLFTIAGTIGRTAVVSDSILPANTNQAVAIARPKAGLVMSLFLRYVLSNPNFTATAINRTVQSVQANFSLTELRDSRLLLPTLEEQSLIVAVLGTLDDRISLLRKTNTTLEAIAQALFKSWLVDFDPVRAKQQGIAPTGMDEATAALFPDSFEASSIGMVPSGWKVRPLDAIATYLNGLALQKFPPTADAWLPVIKIAQLRKGDATGADRASRAIKPEYVVQNGDVLFSWSGSLEVEVWCGGEGALNQHLFKVTSVDYPKWFYFLWTKHHLDHFRQIAASKATTMGHIQRVHLTEAKALVPPAALLDAVNACFASLLERRIENELQAQTLAALRDTLLPRLISGQLRLPQAESQLAAVAV